MKIVFAISVGLTLITGCMIKEDSLSQNDSQLHLNIGDTVGTQISFFKIDNLDYLEMAKKNYVKGCDLKEPFFIEKIKREKSLNKRFSFTQTFIYKSDTNKQMLVFESFYFKKSIDLKTDIIINGEKKYGIEPYKLFYLDTIASSWLTRRNQLIVDSLKFEFFYDNEICGTAQSDFLRKNYPEKQLVYLDEKSSLKIMQTLRNN